MPFQFNRYLNFMPFWLGRYLNFIERNGAFIPIEVKAGSRPTPSLNQYIAKYRSPFAYKLTNTQNGRADEKITLPHYMIMFI